jgi:hypothetical protein
MVVRAIDKAIADDIPLYLSENFKETNNALGQYRGDCINTNLRQMVVTDDITLIPFQRYGWSGRLLVDRIDKVTYTITTQQNLKAIPQKKGRTRPHFLQSILAVENADYRGQYEQTSFYPVEIFDQDILQQDFETIIAGLIAPEEGYRHYIIAYTASYNELRDVRLDFLDRKFNVVDTQSLNKYIKPDFARLTAPEISEGTSEEIPDHSRRPLKLKPGLRPMLPENEDQA